ncbi:MAG: GNAT family N-acetyltransferase [Planctomycetota bacterium]|nr:GNAT family N-acetyltransferase [Planctomycetota bacterium]
MPCDRIRALPPDLDVLRSAARAESFGALDRLARDWHDGTNRFERPGEALFEARVADELVGICGLNVDPFTAGDMRGRLRRLYVLPAARRAGTGRALVRAALAAADGHFGSVVLRTHDPAADAFYLALGFTRIEEPDATHGIDLP